MLGALLTGVLTLFGTVRGNGKDEIFFLMLTNLSTWLNLRI